MGVGEVAELFNDENLFLKVVLCFVGRWLGVCWEVVGIVGRWWGLLGGGSGCF